MRRIGSILVAIVAGILLLPFVWLLRDHEWMD